MKKKICSLFAVAVFAIGMIGSMAKMETKAEDGSVKITDGELPVIKLELSEDRKQAQVSDYAAGEYSSSSKAMNTAKADIVTLTDDEDIIKEKADLFLQTKKDTEFLDLKANTEYILLGGKGDKSLIRNYLGYQIAENIMEDPLEYQLCELIICEDEEEMYQGVYLMVSKKATGDNEVIFDHSTDAQGIPIETYTTQNIEKAENMAISIFEGEEWKDSYDSHLNLLSSTESILYSEDYKIYYEYTEAVDVDSFVNSFLIQEFMENYGSLKTEYIFSDTETGTIGVAPIWNFDTSLDNEKKGRKATDTLRFTKASYYKKLFNSPQFAESCQESYLKLREEGLNEDNLLLMVEEAAEQVESAIERDWERWNSYEDYQLEPLGKKEKFNRQTETYEDEISKIKYRLRSQSLNMGVAIASFDFSGQEISREVALDANPIWAMIFLVGFFVLIRFVRKYGV